jgi:hypothetical protein
MRFKLGAQELHGKATVGGLDNDFNGPHFIDCVILLVRVSK